MASPDPKKLDPEKLDPEKLDPEKLDPEKLDLARWLPRAVAWARAERDARLAVGRPLDGAELELARRVGVRRAERVRLCAVDAFPRPDDPDLRRLADKFGFFGPGQIGLALGYAVLVDRRCAGSERLLRHELRHVRQYEDAGGLDAFLDGYLRQLVTVGYRDASYEVDARRHETLDHRP